MLKRLKTQHWVAVAAFLAAIGGQIGTHEDFRHLASPSFVSFMLVQTGAFLVALFANSSEEDRIDRIDAPKRFDLPDAS